MDPSGLSRTTQMTSRRTARTSWTSPSSQSLPNSRSRKAVVNKGMRGEAEKAAMLRMKNRGEHSSCANK